MQYGCGCTRGRSADNVLPRLALGGFTGCTVLVFMYILNYNAVLYRNIGVGVREGVVVTIFCQVLPSVDSLAELFQFLCIF